MTMQVQPPPFFAKNGDIESGNQQMYPMMQESPELRWAFIRKVYTILTFQLCLTAVVATIVVKNPSIAEFIRKTWAGLGIFIVILVLTLLCGFSLYYFHQKHPINFVLLTLFTILMAFSLGLSCSFRNGKILMQAAVITSLLVIGLTLYTFWAVKRGVDFSFLGPFLFICSLMLFIFAFSQLFFPMGNVFHMIYSWLGALIFSAYIIYDTSNLIQDFSYDEYILASVGLYSDIINLFVFVVSILEGSD